MKEALVTIIMPVYNAEKYLNQAIDSILAQSFDKFILLTINDGSSDDSKRIIKSYNDSRIEYIENEKNLGIVATLNKGICLAKTKYIARMDADDLCTPDRIKLQIEKMEQNNDLALVGTWATLIDENNIKIGELRPPTEDKMIRTALLFSNVFIHSSVMLRRDILNENNWFYNDEHKAVEDFGLWVKIAHKYKIEMIPLKCIQYRINTAGIMAQANKRIDEYMESKTLIYKDTLQQIGLLHNDKVSFMFCKFACGISVGIDQAEIGNLLQNLYLYVKNEKEYDVVYYRKIISGLLRIYGVACKKGVFEYMNFLENEVGYSNSIAKIEGMKFLCTKIMHILSTKKDIG